MELAERKRAERILGGSDVMDAAAAGATTVNYTDDPKDWSLGSRNRMRLLYPSLFDESARLQVRSCARRYAFPYACVRRYAFPYARALRLMDASYADARAVRRRGWLAVAALCRWRTLNPPSSSSRSCPSRASRAREMGVCICHIAHVT